MPRSGGVVIHMQQNSNNPEILNIRYVIGDIETLYNLPNISAMKPFDEKIIDFMNDVSKLILSNRDAQRYPDVITLAFWLRKGSMLKQKERFNLSDNTIYRIGVGRVFHVAPSNVPVNYAYSLFTGLVCGNANIIRISSKDFTQVSIINSAIKAALENHKEIKPYILLLKYDHDSKINDYLSLLADARIIWGGDNTINEIRRSKLNSRANEINFADRYSLAVIDSDVYLDTKNKKAVANDFYNDTYLTDQNACTSPRAVIWVGENKDEAKKQFWDELHTLVKSKYELTGVQAVSKLTNAFLLSVNRNCKKEYTPDNMIVRMKIEKLDSEIMELMDNSGYFFEYDCTNVLDLVNVCNSKKCQTISYIGNIDMFIPLLQSGVNGVDRIVPVGKTMDFDFIWDGYNLIERLTRQITLKR